MEHKRSLNLHGKLRDGGYIYIYDFDDYPGIQVTYLRESRKDPETRTITFNGNEYKKLKSAIQIWSLKNEMTEDYLRRKASNRKGDNMAGKRVFKKTKKMSGGPKTFRAWKEWKVGDFIIGKYVGTHVDQYEKECRIINVVDAEFAKKGDAKKVIGQNLVLNAAGQLDAAFVDKNGNAKIAEGEMVQVMYNGQSQITKGKFAGKDAHLIEVDLVEEEGDEDEEADDEEEIDDEDDGDEDDDSDD